MSTSPHPVGAPRGNRNALKHGFYSNRFTVPRHADKEEVGTLNLSSEISILRLYIARVVELTPPDETLESARETLRLLCIASTALSRLVRAQFLIQGSQGESLADQIFSIAEEVRQEMVARGKAEAAAKSPPSSTVPGPDPSPAAAPLPPQENGASPQPGAPDLHSSPAKTGPGDSGLHTLPSRDAPGAPEGVMPGLGPSSRPALSQDSRDSAAAATQRGASGDGVSRHRHPGKNRLPIAPKPILHPQGEGRS